MKEEPQEEQSMDVPMDEDAEEEAMLEEPAEEEDTEEEPMEQDEQEGVGDPDDGDSSDSSDSDNHGNSGDNGDSDGDSRDHHVVLLAKGWTVEIHFDLHGDAYYHPKLLTLARRYHTRCTVQYRTEHWTHPDYISFWETEAYIEKEVGCATSTVRLPPGLPMQQLSGTLPCKPWWLTATAALLILHGKKIAIYLAGGVVRHPATSLHHLG